MKATAKVRGELHGEQNGGCGVHLCRGKKCIDELPSKSASLSLRVKPSTSINESKSAEVADPSKRILKELKEGRLTTEQVIRKAGLTPVEGTTDVIDPESLKKAKERADVQRMLRNKDFNKAHDEYLANFEQKAGYNPAITHGQKFELAKFVHACIAVAFGIAAIHFVSVVIVSGVDESIRPMIQHGIDLAGVAWTGFKQSHPYFFKVSV